MPQTDRGGALWEERALERTLASARERSSAQVRRLVQAARDLTSSLGPDVTVQQVAAEAGVSLKTLYRCFSGKDDLLLAVFEEDNRMAADLLAQRMALHDSPVTRLREFVVGLFELATAGQDAGYIGLVMREYFRLAQEHSEEVEHVLSPYVDLVAQELAAAVDQGLVEVRDVRRDATAIFLTTVSHLCPLVLADKEADSTDAAEFVASFCLRALGVRS